MAITGRIKTLFNDADRQEALFPRTKINAISDDNGVGLGVILEDMVYTGDDSNDTVSVPINADTLGGRPASEYATQNFVSNEIAKAQLSGGDSEIDLSGFATSDNLNAHVNNANNPHNVTIEQIGAAPAGYGLGGNPSEHIIFSTAALNALYANCFFVFAGGTGDPVPSSGHTINYGYGHMDVYTDARAKQTLIPISPTFASTLVRYKQEGTWGEWEWENPPMVPGVEYRTTKRHKGKPVYALMLPGGTLAGKTAFSINLSDRNIAEFVDWRCGFGSSTAVPYDLYQWWGLRVDILYKPTQPAIYGFNNMEDACSDARFYLEYIKTTD